MLNHATPPHVRSHRHRLDDGARWEIEAADVPGAHVEVIDLAQGSEAMRTVLTERLQQPIDDISLQIVLA